MVSRINCGMVMGTVAKMAKVEADISPGLPTMEMTGNLSSSLKDSKERIRVAIKKSGYSFPQSRITVNISPADYRKDGTAFDLPIACALLCEIGAIDKEKVGDCVFVGELGLDGSVLPVRGILTLTLAAKSNGFSTIIVPHKNKEEAGLVREINIVGVRTLEDVIGFFSDGVIEEGEVNELPEKEKTIVQDKKDEPDFSDVLGQTMAKRAILVAVSGMHNILMMGPPGAGKTMLASRIPTIMTELTYDEMIDITGIYSLAGILENNRIIERRPFRSPHHSVTGAALIGGGSFPIPGECSLSSKGVLFLDELTKYSPTVLDSLREPLEDKKIIINRMSGTYEFPADFMLVAAMNPCGCGYFPDRNKCRCSTIEIKKHFGRISKPLMDRMDICVSVTKAQFNEIYGNVYQKNDKASDKASDKANGKNETIFDYSSENMRKIVEKTWAIQRERYGGNRFNNSISSKEIEKYCQVDNDARDVLEEAYNKFDLSARAYHKVLKVARTLADMNGSDKITYDNVLEALGLRIKVAE